MPPSNMVAFSESEEEEYIEIGSLRSLDLYEVKLIHEKFVKRCQHCKTVKPPRTHHCSQCNRCVVRMDHHCVWIGNCVGLHNMKPFLLFLYYSILTTTVSSILCLVEVFRCYIFNTDGKQCNLDENLDAPDGLFEINMAISGIGMLVILCLGFLTLAVWVA